jgi:hypothetical protein
MEYLKGLFRRAEIFVAIGPLKKPFMEGFFMVGPKR